MSLLPELRNLEATASYKHCAPNGALEPTKAMQPHPLAE